MNESDIKTILARAEKAREPEWHTHEPNSDYAASSWLDRAMESVDDVPALCTALLEAWKERDAAREACVQLAGAVKKADAELVYLRAALARTEGGGGERQEQEAVERVTDVRRRGMRRGRHLVRILS